MKKLLILCLSLLMTHSLVSYAGLPATDSQGEKLPSLAPMLKKVNPAVVNISTFSKRRNNNPLLNDPFFRHFFDLPEESYQQKKRQQSAGSGVIVDKRKGIILTNHHVIKDSDEVVVSLIDGRSFQAQLVGSDPDLDIAVLKIEAKNLSEVNITDSEHLEVGDFVVAIGNPFGLGQTVTTGIVSALGRTGLGIEGYENFIQTDASINPGNSGGALVNLRGELVGINTAIIAPAGGNVGIGFAIPSNMAKASMLQILEHGEVRRGQIGVSIQDITADLRSAFNLKNGQQGVLVTGVAEGSSAEKAGILPGDVIIAVEGDSTESTGELRSQIGILEIGDRTTITVLREKKTLNFKVQIGEPLELSSISGKVHKLFEGTQFEDHPDKKGVVVSKIAPNSNAAVSGLRVNDVIVGVNKNKVTDMASFKQALSLDDQKALVHISRNGGLYYLVIR